MRITHLASWMLAASMAVAGGAWGQADGKAQAAGKAQGETKVQADGKADAKAPADTKHDRRANARQMPAAVDRTSTQEARKGLESASEELRRNELALVVMPAKLEAEFRQSEQFISAMTEFRAAMTELEELRKPIRESLRNDPEWQKANEARTAAQAKAALLRDSGQASFEEIVQAASAALEAGTFMTRAEAVAMNGDPAIVEARSRAVDAWLKLSLLRLEFVNSLKANPAIEQARKSLEDSRLKYKQASDVLSDALKREEAADRERRQRLEDLARQLERQRNR